MCGNEGGGATSRKGRSKGSQHEAQRGQRGRAGVRTKKGGKRASALARPRPPWTRGRAAQGAVGAGKPAWMQRPPLTSWGVGRGTPLGVAKAGPTPTGGGRQEKSQVPHGTRYCPQTGEKPHTTQRRSTRPLPWGCWFTCADVGLRQVERFGLKRLQEMAAKMGRNSKGRPRLLDDQVTPASLYQWARRERMKREAAQPAKQRKGR